MKMTSSLVLIIAEKLHRELTRKRSVRQVARDRRNLRRALVGGPLTRRACRESASFRKLVTAASDLLDDILDG